MTVDHLVEAAIETLQWFKEHQVELSKEDMERVASKSTMLKYVALYPTKIQKPLKPIMSTLTAERLLELSAIFHPAPGHYDLTM